jgi:hypothetical protein
MHRQSSKEFTNHDRKITRGTSPHTKRSRDRNTNTVSTRSASIDSDFSNASAGNSETIPVKIGSLRIGHLVMLKGFPCKINHMSRSKCGKHGHAKMFISGKDIFTQKKYEEVHPASHNIDQPILTKT